MEIEIPVRQAHPQQARFINSSAKRKVIRAGRRGGKTTGIAILAIKALLARRRVLYATPTQEQVDAFWFEVKRALQPLIDAKILYCNETRHIIEFPSTKARIRAKTAWNADSLRGDYGDLLILDEYQLMDEEAWSRVGAPMLLDNNGDAVFIYTPPSLRSRSRSKARDPRHAAKLFQAAQADTTGRWETFHFTSHDNPHISAEALEDLALDMSSHSYAQEILAEDSDQASGALWNRETIDTWRVLTSPTPLQRIVIGVDPPGGATECGIITAGIDYDGHAYVLDDRSAQVGPAQWGGRIVSVYESFDADRVAGEDNYGGDMVENTIRQVPGGEAISYKSVHATRGKAIRAEPIRAKSGYHHQSV